MKCKKIDIYFKLQQFYSKIMASEVDKCYLSDLLGDFEEFKDIKEQFDAQHECWKKQNESKNEDISKGKLKSYENNSHGRTIESEIRNDKVQESVPNHKVFSKTEKSRKNSRCKSKKKF